MFRECHKTVIITPSQSANPPTPHLITGSRKFNQHVIRYRDLEDVLIKLGIQSFRKRLGNICTHSLRNLWKSSDRNIALKCRIKFLANQLLYEDRIVCYIHSIPLIWRPLELSLQCYALFKNESSFCD